MHLEQIPGTLYLVVDNHDPENQTVCDSMEVAEWHVEELRSLGIIASIVPRWVRTKEDCDG